MPAASILLTGLLAASVGVGNGEESGAAANSKPRQVTVVANDATGEQAWLAHGFTASQRAEIRNVFRWATENQFVPGGVLLIVHRGEPIFREAFCVADV